MLPLIWKYPAPILRKVAEPISFDTSEAITLSNKLKMILPKSGGIAVAAPQIGISKQAFAYYDLKHNIHALFNPTLEVVGESHWQYHEGCLSLPQSYTLVRPRTVRIKAFTSLGEPFEAVWSDLMGRMAQHEVDHLKGRLIIDLAKEQL